MRVYVLYDEVGSHKLSKERLAKFAATGVQVLPFNTRRGKTKAQPVAEATA